jgi:hypothetical protein
MKSTAMTRGSELLSALRLSADHGVVLWRVYDSVVVPVADLRRDESRVPGFRESLHVDAEAYIYRAKSNGATIEIALTPSQAEWVVGLLVGNESP